MAQGALVINIVRAVKIYSSLSAIPDAFGCLVFKITSHKRSNRPIFNMVRFLHAPWLWRILKTKEITAKLNDEYSASFSYSSRSEARILIYRNWPKPYLFIYLFIYFNLFNMLFLAICKQCNEFLSKKALISQMRKSAAAPRSRELEGVSRK